MRIGAVTLAYNDEDVIEGTIKCLRHFVDRHVVLISEKPYFGEPAPPDRTEEICEDLDCEVIKGVWELDHQQRTLGNKMLSDCDWVITFDSDEMMTKDEMEQFISFLETAQSDAITCLPTVYWKDINHILYPKPDYQPVIATRPSVEFIYIRNVNCPFQIYPGDMHHLSWCYPKDIYKKVTNYAHATDFDGKQWYVENYVNWNSDSDHACLPDKTYGVKKQSLPQELADYLPKK
jgi:hypothetical protein